MTKHISIFKLFTQNLFAKIRQAISGDEEFQVEIKPYSKRSQNALNAYWMLIDRVVEWDSENNGYPKDVWDEWFKTEANLMMSFDLMPIWKLKFKEQLSEPGVVIKEIEAADSCTLIREDGEEGFHDVINDLGSRHEVKTRSISNKGDVTKAEMKRLLLTVIKFGAENDVPDCFVTNKELDKLLKFYD